MMFSEQELQDLRERTRESIEHCRALRAEQERIVRESNMTVVDLLEMLEPDQNTYLNHKKVEEVLSLILERAAGYYDDYREDSVGEYALGIALAVVQANSIIDKQTANGLASDMASLVDWLLQEAGAGEWDFGILVALKRIRRAAPALVKQEWEQKRASKSNGGTATPRTQAEIEADANCPTTPPTRRGI